MVLNKNNIYVIFLFCINYLFFFDKVYAAQNTKCGQQNLLFNNTQIHKKYNLLTDGIYLHEGANPRNKKSLVLYEQKIILPLQSLEYISAIFIQKSAFTPIIIEGFTGKSWVYLGTALPKYDKQDLSSQWLYFTATYIDQIRLIIPNKYQEYAISEVQVYCQKPQYPMGERQLAKMSWREYDALGFMNNWLDIINIKWMFAVSIFAFLFGIIIFFEKKISKKISQYWINFCLILLTLASMGTYLNFAVIRHGEYIYAWDVYHYYIGAKYHDILDYTDLYDCTLAADMELSVHEGGTALKQIRNLKNNQISHIDAHVIRRAQACSHRFSSIKWKNFKQDILFFKQKNGYLWDYGILTDHGYNATPFLTKIVYYAHSIFKKNEVISDQEINKMTLIDPVLLIICFLLISWGFNWRIACMAFIILGLFYPIRVWWSGGTLLRWDWVFFSVLAVCFAKKEKYFWVGFCLAIAVLLRIFPVIFLLSSFFIALRIGVNLQKKIGWKIWLNASELKSYRHVLYGALSALFLGFIISIMPINYTQKNQGISWESHINNLKIDQSVPWLTNIGLKAVLAYRPNFSARYTMIGSNTLEPGKIWKDHKKRALNQIKYIHIVLCMMFILFLWKKYENITDKIILWESIILGALFIPFILQPVDYYYGFILIIALLCGKNIKIFLWLILLCMITNAIGLFRPFDHKIIWVDESRILISVFILIFFIVIICLDIKNRHICYKKLGFKGK